MGQAAFAPEPAPQQAEPAPQPTEPSFDVLRWRDEPWTAQLALDLLPETNGPKVEVLSGSVIVTPPAGYDHQDAELDLAYLLKQAARRAKLWLYLEANVVSGDDLFIPDIVILDVPGGGRTTMDIGHAVLLGEIVSPGNRRKDVIDRPREYAAAGVPFFLRVDLRNRVPTMALFKLTEGEYRPLSAAAAGSTFTMIEPFEFSIDPGDLLGEEAPEEGEEDPAGQADAEG
ncbi:Uma2 family endonuclease [Micromonospora sp. AMSO12t]|uniref:Uma2 family endonuclease n=1 Tax=Micromonospora sp. AMSO12t TaxID=2650410 RepID=UPI00124B5DD8|nr:Uma2 family endonuclease [Micromonospora sp. AMSO12t]KAB1138894.1 Uma2 family endonuclease [Micromonospora sp. AMSO12t]